MPRLAMRSVTFLSAALRVVLLGTAVSSSVEPAETAGTAARPAAAPSRLEVTFKVDERLTRGLYMGDRWVSPPTYTANLPAGSAAVDARADVVEPGGRRSPAVARWATSDADVAAVSPSEGAAVRISLLRDGEARLQVTAGGLSRELVVTAVRKETALLVEIQQQKALEHAAASAPRAAPPMSKEKNGYAVGLYLGRRMKQQGWNVDPEALSRGLADALAGTGTAEMTDAEAAAVLAGLRAEARSRSRQ